MKEELNTTKQASQILGVPKYTIRSYCNKGLVPHVRRARNGYRIFTPGQVDWLRTIIKLRAAGMGINELKKYVALCRKGNSTIVERKAMLETQKRQLWQELENIQAGIDFIERKMKCLIKSCRVKKSYQANGFRTQPKSGLKIFITLMYIVL